MTRVPICALSIALAVGACSGGPLAVCTDELRVSLRVSVVDAVTGASAATGSTIILRGAAFQDSVVLTKDSPYVQWEDSARAGVYDVMVRKLFAPHSKFGIFQIWNERPGLWIAEERGRYYGRGPKGYRRAGAR